MIINSRPRSVRQYPPSCPVGEILVARPAGKILVVARPDVRDWVVPLVE